MCSQADEQKAAGAAGGVVDGLTRLRIDHAHHRVDQRARREILPRTRLDLLRIAFEQALVDRAFDVDAEPEPGLAVDQPDETPELGRVLDLVLRFQKDRADNAGEARELVEDRRIAAASTLRPAGRAILPSGNPRGSPRLSPLIKPEVTSPARSSSILRNKRYEICEI